MRFFLLINRPFLSLTMHGKEMLSPFFSFQPILLVTFLLLPCVFFLQVIAAISYQIVPADTQYAEIPLAAVSFNYQRKVFYPLFFMLVLIRTFFFWLKIRGLCSVGMLLL